MRAGFYQNVMTIYGKMPLLSLSSTRLKAVRRDKLEVLKTFYFILRIGIWF